MPTLFNFLGKPLKFISSNHTWLTYRCGKIFWYPSWWPWVKVAKLLKRDRFYLVPTTKIGRYIPIVMRLVYVNVKMNVLWPPSTVWVGPLIFLWQPSGCLNNPIFSTLGLYAKHPKGHLNIHQSISSWNLAPMQLGVKMLISLWNLAGGLAAELMSHLPSSRALKKS